MSTEINAQTKVGRCVAEHPHTARVFESLQIDYCCGGGITLAEACRKHNLEAQQVVDQLTSAIDQPPQSTPQNWNEASLADLCQHIVQTHHAYLRTELPRLTGLIDRVAQAHGENHPSLLDLRIVFAELRGELEPHMAKEEQILFPAVCELERAGEIRQFPFGTVANPIQMMEHEHDVAGTALKRIRKLTNNFAVPEDACNTYRVMLDGLRQLEQDMHEHIHKENNILFPRAQQLESRFVAAKTQDPASI